ncbi:hypothetical protein L596_018544 [Steinernema carpocapsae]|uniref:Uncharacterized protein n=1 Tax=Steinernema carpocapsae TaxID=34508 RepID=A0A4U5N4Z9_STECR|nr:hypothetical protein L596_018544 [Steinernema carpocapsae]
MDTRHLIFHFAVTNDQAELSRRSPSSVPFFRSDSQKTTSNEISLFLATVTRRRPQRCPGHLDTAVGDGWTYYRNPGGETTSCSLHASAHAHYKLICLFLRPPG